jgi:hypothetical protein
MSDCITTCFAASRHNVGVLLFTPCFFARYLTACLQHPLLGTIVLLIIYLLFCYFFLFTILLAILYSNLLINNYIELT